MTAPIRVGLNFLWIRPGIVGGSEVSAVATANALRRRPEGELDLRVYAQGSFRRAHPDVARRIPTRTVDVPRDSLAARVAPESTWLVRRARADRVDLVHFYGGVVAPGFRGPSLLTIHDVQPLEDGSTFGALKRTWLRRMIPSSVDRATVVAVPSEFVRNRLLSLTDANPADVVVVHHGTEPISEAAERTLPDPGTVRRTYRLVGPYVLYPAITYSHKNHITLIEAFARVVGSRPGLTLVLAGGAGEADAQVSEAIERFGIGSSVRRVGRIPGADLAVLLREAAVVGFPSRYEGFGLPVLEAFAFDTPVVAAAAGSLPEVVGDAGVLVDADDVEGWVEALLGSVDGAQDGEEATQRRRARVDHFSWDRVVDELVPAYRRVVRDAESSR
ncbi:MAG: glycosyltransferase family 4 protein [Actinobacteria bacterium]|nr:glycosyltransferase family 4 protein [Actinomycetota bacterium]